jgi:hypothetical protein
MVELVRHRQTKGPGTDRLDLNHRATSRLYNGKIGVLATSMAPELTHAGKARELDRRGRKSADRQRRGAVAKRLDVEAHALEDHGI